MRNRTILFFLRECKFAEQYFLFIIQQLQKNYNVVVVHFSKLNEASADNNYNLKNIDLSDLSNKEIQRDKWVKCVRNFKLMVLKLDRCKTP